MSNQIKPVHWLKVAFDVFSVLSLFLVFESIKIVAKPFKTSFDCNDFTINMPFKSSTVNNLNLIIMSLVMPFAVILLTEGVRSAYSRHSAHFFDCKLKLFNKRIIQIPEQLAHLYVNCGSFFFGLTATAVLTDFGKILVGRLRPNFLDVCKPNVNPYTDLCVFKNKTFLVPEVDFKCTSTDLSKIEDSRMSFPSGHSSISFYSMIFLILFINQTWNFRRFGLMPRLCQLMLFSLAVFTSLSRIVDNKHHPTDVLAGVCLGSCMSLCTYAYLTSVLNEKKKQFKVKYCSIKANNFDDENIQDSCSIQNRNHSNFSACGGIVNEVTNTNLKK